MGKKKSGKGELLEICPSTDKTQSRTTQRDYLLERSCLDKNRLLIDSQIIEAPKTETLLKKCLQTDSVWHLTELWEP